MTQAKPSEIGRHNSGDFVDNIVETEQGHNSVPLKLLGTGCHMKPENEPNPGEAELGESPSQSHLFCFLLIPVSVRFSITCIGKNPAHSCSPSMSSIVLLKGFFTY